MRSSRMTKNLVAVVAVLALSSFPLMARPSAPKKPTPKRPPAVVLPVPTVLGDLMGPLPATVVMAAAGLASDLSTSGILQELPIWPYSSGTVLYPNR